MSNLRLYRTLDAVARCAPDRRRVVAVGVFDGLHLGHQSILARARSLAAQANAATLVFSFEPTPREFFAPDNPPARLTRFRERFELLEQHGVDELFCPPFRAVRDLPAGQFTERVLARGLNAVHVVVGDDFRYGAGRAGSSATLRADGARLGFDVSEVPPVYCEGQRVSSTAIRAALAAGDLAAAKAMLGRDYSISGRVVPGLRLGRKLGFPTANVHLKRRQAPIDGIFAARVGGLGPDLLDGVASVGSRPTIGGGRVLLEVYIFGYDRDIYGRYITVHFVKRLREERHFADLEALKRQIELDVREAQAALRA